MGFSTRHDVLGHLEDMRHEGALFDLWRWGEDVDWQPQEGTHFGAVSRGTVTVDCASGEFRLKEGMAFCVPGRMCICGSGTVFGVTAQRYEGLFQIEGLMFHLKRDVLHGFRTGDESMDVVAFHPDTDFGPQDEDHPMINRTLVDGVSASQIAKIRT